MTDYIILRSRTKTTRLYTLRPSIIWYMRLTAGRRILARIIVTSTTGGLLAAGAGHLWRRTVAISPIVVTFTALRKLCCISGSLASSLWDSVKDEVVTIKWKRLINLERVIASRIACLSCTSALDAPVRQVVLPSQRRSVVLSMAHSDDTRVSKEL